MFLLCNYKRIFNLISVDLICWKYDLKIFVDVYFVRSLSQVFRKLKCQNNFQLSGCNYYKMNILIVMLIKIMAL